VPGSNQKSVVRQLKQMGLCLPPKRQQRTVLRSITRARFSWAVAHGT